MSTRPRSHTGFTLIEVLIVMAIIGIISAIAIPLFSNYRAKACNGNTLSDMRNFKTSMEAFYTDQLQLPDTIR